MPRHHHHHHGGWGRHHHHHHGGGAGLAAGLIAGAAVAGAVGMAAGSRARRQPGVIYGAPAPMMVGGQAGVVYTQQSVSLAGNQQIVIPGQGAVVQHQVPLVNQIPPFRITSISVASFRKVKGNILYALHVRATSGQEWVVEKRYSQIDAWKTTHIRRADAGWPGKHFFSLSQKQINERRAKLHEWFTQLVIRAAVNNAVQQAIYHFVKYHDMVKQIPVPGTAVAPDPRGGLPLQQQVPQPSMAVAQAQQPGMAVAQVVSAQPVGAAAQPPVAQVYMAEAVNVNGNNLNAAAAQPSAPTFL